MVFDRGLVLFFCVWISSLPSIIYWRDYSSLLENSLLPCQILVDRVYFWALHSVPLIHISLFVGNNSRKRYLFFPKTWNFCVFQMWLLLLHWFDFTAQKPMRSLDKAPARVAGTILSGMLPHPPISLSSSGSDLSSHLNASPAMHSSSQPWCHYSHKAFLRGTEECW